MNQSLMGGGISALAFEKRIKELEEENRTLKSQILHYIDVNVGNVIIESRNYKKIHTYQGVLFVSVCNWGGASGSFSVANTGIDIYAIGDTGTEIYNLNIRIWYQEQEETICQI